MIDYVYDIETYPNFFSIGAINPASDDRWTFEISDRADESAQLLNWLQMLQRTAGRMVGFNNIGFDYPVIHRFMSGGYTVQELYAKAQAIIDCDDRFAHTIWASDQLIPQLDLYKIHHFDNMARATSLKMLEFNMRRQRIEDLPYKPGTYLTSEQMDKTLEYMWEDISATVDFYHETKEQIEFREALTIEHQRDFINHNDTKIGKDFFIMQLEAAQPGSCYDYSSGSREMRQTHRGAISLVDVIFPYVKFEHPELQRIHKWLTEQVVRNADGMFKDISCTINDFQFDFGKGGIHGSMTDTIVVADMDYAIIDLDVTSYYPSLAIVNKLHPEHLGTIFCDIYAGIKAQRALHAKGTTGNKMLKLALNGVYGDTGNKFSPFFDLKYLLSITINGQLLLCMLAEQLMKIPNLTMIQVNTDGLTIRIPYDAIGHMEQVVDWWQRFTMLDLERADYSRMFIRDVNNYIGEYLDGSLKRKGAYENLPPGQRNPTGWHQDLSALVIPLAVEAYLVRGVSIESFIHHHPDIMDFMSRTKVPRASQLMWGDTPMQRITRYLITRTGHALTKVSPPADGYVDGQWKRKGGITDQFYNEVRLELLRLELQGDMDTTGHPWDSRINTGNNSVYGTRHMGIDVGWLVTPFNDLTRDTPDRSQINYDYYIQAAHKLVDRLRILR